MRWQARAQREQTCASPIPTVAHTHIFPDVLVLDCLVGGVRRIQHAAHHAEETIETVSQLRQASTREKQENTEIAARELQQRGGLRGSPSASPHCWAAAKSRRQHRGTWHTGGWAHKSTTLGAAIHPGRPCWQRGSAASWRESGDECCQASLAWAPAPTPLLPPKINLLPLPTGSLVFSLVGQQLLGGRNVPCSPPHHNLLPPLRARPSSNNATPRQSRGTLHFSLQRWRLGDNVGLQCPFLGCFFALEGEPRNILQPNHRKRRDLFFCTNHYYICKKKFLKSSRASFDLLDSCSSSLCNTEVHCLRRCQWKTSCMSKHDTIMAETEAYGATIHKQNKQ